MEKASFSAHSHLPCALFEENRVLGFPSLQYKKIIYRKDDFVKYFLIFRQKCAIFVDFYCGCAIIMTQSVLGKGEIL